MRTIIHLTFFYFLLIPCLTAQNMNDEEVLENLLHDFLQGASVNDSKVHDRFWAEDLIYTSSNGERVTKEDIMNGLRENDDYDANSETQTYRAEEIQVRLFGDMAVVAFKLIASSPPPNRSETMEFYNTGTFQKRNNEWKAVAWQATRIPADE